MSLRPAENMPAGIAGAELVKVVPGAAMEGGIGTASIEATASAIPAENMPVVIAGAELVKVVPAGAVAGGAADEGPAPPACFETLALFAASFATCFGGTARKSGERVVQAR